MMARGFDAPGNASLLMGRRDRWTGLTIGDLHDRWKESGTFILRQMDRTSTFIRTNGQDVLNSRDYRA